MNLYHHSTRKVSFTVLTSLIACFQLSPVMAQNNILKKSQEAREMINELKEKEKELRQQLTRDIQEKREDTLDYLTRLERRYRRNNKNGEANSIKAEIEKLREQFEKNKPNKPVEELAKDDDQDKDEEKEKLKGNSYVIYEKKYEFKDSKISGYLTFKQGNKVVIHYTLNNSKQEAEYNVHVRSNHLFLDTKSTLGKIYISEIPDTERLAVMIRWGGDIKHEISKASIK